MSTEPFDNILSRRDFLKKSAMAVATRTTLFGVLYLAGCAPQEAQPDDYIPTSNAEIWDNGPFNTMEVRNPTPKPDRLANTGRSNMWAEILAKLMSEEYQLFRLPAIRCTAKNDVNQYLVYPPNSYWTGDRKNNFTAVHLPLDRGSLASFFNPLTKELDQVQDGRLTIQLAPRIVDYARTQRIEKWVSALRAAETMIIAHTLDFQINQDVADDWLSLGPFIILPGGNQFISLQHLLTDKLSVTIKDLDYSDFFNKSTYKEMFVKYDTNRSSSERSSEKATLDRVVWNTHHLTIYDNKRVEFFDKSRGRHEYKINAKIPDDFIFPKLFVIPGTGETISLFIMTSNRDGKMEFGVVHYSDKKTELAVYPDPALPREFFLPTTNVNGALKILHSGTHDLFRGLPSGFARVGQEFALPAVLGNTPPTTWRYNDYIPIKNVVGQDEYAKPLIPFMD